MVGTPVAPFTRDAKVIARLLAGELPAVTVMLLPAVPAVVAVMVTIAPAEVADTPTKLPLFGILIAAARPVALAVALAP
jgi:hypothetical protein